jgi:predicted enzyme related to lactoylglutathione lyase
MGNPFCHVELNCDDPGKAKKFYKSLFSWKLSAMGPYTLVDVGGGVGGGMQKKPMPEAPTMWLPYVQVDDVKKTIAKAKKLGANVMVDYMPIGEMGAIGIFVDPAGAGLGVWESAKKPAKKGAKKAAKKGGKKSAKKK